MCRKISASVDGGPSRGSRMHRPGSEDPHRRQWKLLIIFYAYYACMHFRGCLTFLQTCACTETKIQGSHTQSNPIQEVMNNIQYKHFIVAAMVKPIQLRLSQAKMISALSDLGLD